MVEKLVDPPSPAEGESAARADSLAARAGRAVHHLGERMRTLGDLAGAGLGPTVQTVRQNLGDAFGHLRRARHLGIIIASGRRPTICSASTTTKTRSCAPSLRQP